MREKPSRSFVGGAVFDKERGGYIDRGVAGCHHRGNLLLFDEK